MLSEATKRAQPTRATGQRGALVIRDSLRDEILWLKRAPGTALDEVQLSSDFGVSRTPVREALLLLASNDLVQFLTNRTTIVAPLNLDNLGHLLDTALLLSRSVAIAAAVSGKSDRVLLEHQLKRHRDGIAAQDFEAALKEDNLFRRSLAGATGNKYLIKFMDQVLFTCNRMKLLYYFPSATPSELNDAADLMQKLIEATGSGDTTASDAVIAQFIKAEFDIVARAHDPRFAPTMPIDKPSQSLSKETK